MSVIFSNSSTVPTLNATNFFSTELYFTEIVFSDNNYQC